MGKLTGGIDYDMIGRLANHVGRRIRGENIIAMRPSKSSKPPTQALLNQRAKFALVNSWLRRIGAVVKTGFGDSDSAMSARNAATSYNLKNAVMGIYPNYTVNYPKVVLSQGSLDEPYSPGAAAAPAAKIDFSWQPVIGDGNATGTDKLTFVVYNADKDKFVTLKGVALRSALTYSMQLPPDFSGDDVDAWLFASSADGKLISDSKYVGQVGII